MGPVQPPQRKGRMPQYARDQLEQLQTKFDELEAMGVFQRPEDLNIVAEYLNPSFLVKKRSGVFRLVTAFTDVGRYSKPQPSLMPDVDSTLRGVARIFAQEGPQRMLRGPTFADMTGHIIIISKYLFCDNGEKMCQFCTLIFLLEIHACSGVARALIGGVHIHIFVFCPTDFF